MFYFSLKPIANTGFFHTITALTLDIKQKMSQKSTKKPKMTPSKSGAKPIIILIIIAILIAIVTPYIKTAQKYSDTDITLTTLEAKFAS
jgi:hypothetical protein